MASGEIISLVLKWTCEDASENFAIFLFEYDAASAAAILASW